MKLNVEIPCQNCGEIVTEFLDVCFVHLNLLCDTCACDHEKMEVRELGGRVWEECDYLVDRLYS